MRLEGNRPPGFKHVPGDGCAVVIIAFFGGLAMIGDVAYLMFH